MDCHDVQRNIPSLLYGELGEEPGRALQEHIRHCPACRREWESSRDTMSLLDQWADIASPLDPASFIEKARSRLAPVERRTVRLRRWLPFVAAAGLLLSFFFLFVEVEVSPESGGLVITVGRPPTDDAAPFPGSAGEIENLVHQEVECSIQDLFEIIGYHLDGIMEKQERNHTLLARALQLQREEDLRSTRQMLRQVAVRSAAESEKTKRICEELAGIVCREMPELPSNRRQPMQH